MQFILGTPQTTQRQAEWLPLFEGVELRLVPLADWTEFSRLRDSSKENYLVGVQKGTLINMRQFLKLLVEATRPEAWRGFLTEDQQDAPFSTDALFTALCNNEDLAVAFVTVLEAQARQRMQQQVKSVKNSGAGPDTSPITPGSKKRK